VLVFAYDGSLNGDWVAHYAVRFAANTSARKLRLVHIKDVASELGLGERVARIADECKVLGVVLETELAPRRGVNVVDSLLDIVPRRATLIAGLRARPRNRAAAQAQAGDVRGEARLIVCTACEPPACAV
jgi:hypothetical protein